MDIVRENSKKVQRVLNSFSHLGLFIYLFIHFLNHSYSGSVGTEGWCFQGFIFPDPAIPQTIGLKQFL